MGKTRECFKNYEHNLMLLTPSKISADLNSEHVAQFICVGAKKWGWGGEGKD